LSCKSFRDVYLTVEVGQRRGWIVVQTVVVLLADRRGRTD
jgi:hypothetical protein